MTNINVNLSDKAHKILVNYKLDNKIKTIEECLNKILIELKGGQINESK